MAVSEGKSRAAQEAIEKLGATNIIVRSVKPSEEAQASSGRPARVLNYGLKYDDFDRIVQTVPTIQKILPIREIRKEVRHIEKALDARVVGTTSDYADFQRLELARGRFLTESDNEHFENFAVLAAGTAAELFPFEDPILQSVKVGDAYYTVIGVMKERASSSGTGGSFAAQDFNKDVYIPLNTCRLRFGEKIINMRSGSMEAEETQLSQITIQVNNIDEVMPTDPVLRMAVEPWHPKRDVTFTVPLELLQTAKREALQSLLLLGAIAAVSLIVGGIGIMNIMLATVTERTREIGIRRALGAKRRDITQQFLIETVVLSGVGGILGVSIGVAVPFLLTKFMPDMRTYVTPQSVIIAFSVSLIVGIASGLYPAMRAAKMDPIEALRHE
jgi:putative ABC transport system permease protein